MKNIIQYIGLGILIVFSFFYTEKAVTTIKSKDPLMIEIEEKSNEYSVSAIDAITTDLTIIPGMKGCEVDVEESYYKIKKLGEFNSNLLEYVTVEPVNKSTNKYDKYIISGNKEKNTISFIFKVKENTDIDNVIEILDKNNVKGTFFIDGAYIENNIKKVRNIINNGHEVLNYGYKNKYNKDLIVWNNNLIEQINYNNPKFCYVEEYNDEILNLCKDNEMKTVLPNIIINKKPLIEVKTNISKGSLISFNINNTTEKELNLVIDYVIKKGYKIDIVSKHLKETTMNICKKCKTCD